MSPRTAAITDFVASVITPGEITNCGTSMITYRCD